MFDIRDFDMSRGHPAPDSYTRASPTSYDPTSYDPTQNSTSVRDTDYQPLAAQSSHNLSTSSPNTISGHAARSFDTATQPEVDPNPWTSSWPVIQESSTNHCHRTHDVSSSSSNALTVPTVNRKCSSDSRLDVVGVKRQRRAEPGSADAVHFQHNNPAVGGPQLRQSAGHFSDETRALMLEFDRVLADRLSGLAGDVPESAGGRVQTVERTAQRVDSWCNDVTGQEVLERPAELVRLIGGIRLDDVADTVVDCAGRSSTESATVPEWSSDSHQAQGPPTPIKLATMTTRTNMKQLLQMQHTREMEWREQSGRGSSNAAAPAAAGGGGGSSCGAGMTSSSSGGATVAVAVPQPSTSTAPATHMAVPSDVFKFHSQLQNPTKYHIVASAKRQVHDFLSTTQGNGVSLLVNSMPTSPAAATTDQSGASTSYGTAGAGSSAPTTLPSSGVPSPDSPGDLCSSTATSVSGIDEVELIEGIMGLQKDLLQPSTLPVTDSSHLLDLYSGGAEGGSGGGSQLVAKSCPPLASRGHIHPLAKDRQKKDNHNMIERRRRYNINDRIKELETLLPKGNEPLYNRIRLERQNKGTILKATVDYIREMKSEMNRAQEEAKEKKRLEQENFKLRLQFKQLQCLYSEKAAQPLDSSGDMDVALLLNDAFAASSSGSPALGQQLQQQEPGSTLTVRIKREVEADVAEVAYPSPAYSSPAYSSPAHMMSPQQQQQQLDEQLDDDNRHVIHTVGSDPMLTSLMPDDDDMDMDYIS